MRATAVVSAMLAICLLATGCDGVDRDAPATGPERRDFKPPRKAEPPLLARKLDAESIQPCMPKERIAPETLSGRYFGPIDFATDQVRTARGIDFSAPADLHLVEPDEFARLLSEATTTLSRKQRAINRWIEWGFAIPPRRWDRKRHSNREVAALVAGFYLPGNDRLVVKQRGELDSEYEALAHELAHAAVDQAFGLPRRLSTLLVDDEDLALSALAEGDATLTQLQVVGRFATKKALSKGLKRMLESERVLDRQKEAGTPTLHLLLSAFPYRWGLFFACSLYRDGGWARVDRAYADPPRSTADIMFPKRYLAGEREERPAPFPEPPEPWKVFAEGKFGAMHLMAMLEAPADKWVVSIGDQVARVGAWGGGRYQVWAQGLKKSDAAFAVNLVERRAQRGLLCGTLIEWAKVAFKFSEEKLIADGTVIFPRRGRVTIISCRGRDVRLVTAPSREIAEAAVGV